MAKQSSLIKIKGKADGQSFYTSKNGGALMRSINQGMSARVKDSKEYANTRLNNAEFGAAGSLAGAIVKGITSRWRFILNPIATGMLVKTIKKLQVANTTLPWGSRAVNPGNFFRIRDAFTAMAKNPLPELIVNAIANTFTYDDDSNKVKISAELNPDPELVSELAGYGADGFICKVYGYAAHGGASADSGDWDLGAYTDLEEYPSLGSSATGGVDENSVILRDDTPSKTIAFQNDENNVAGVLVLFFPTRTIGGETQVLQQHCSAAWLAAKSGTIE